MRTPITLSEEEVVRDQVPELVPDSLSLRFGGRLRLDQKKNHYLSARFAEPGFLLQLRID